MLKIGQAYQVNIMKQYNVTGMHCAACSARVEKAVSKVEGVTSCSVSLLTNSLGVEGDVSDREIIKAIKKAGYGASVKKKDKSEKAVEEIDDSLEDKDTPVLKKRLIWSLFFLIILMYFSMGHMMWNWPLPSFYDNNHVAMGLTQMLLTIIIMVINQQFFISGYKSLFQLAPNMDTLVALGSSAAFGYSTVSLFLMTSAQVKGDEALVMKYMMELYFESAAMILTLITVGKMLESHSKGKTTDALKSLMKLVPKTANVIRDGKEININASEVLKDDVFVVRPGENIPVDGVVIEGHSAVNESALTGESIPVDKEENSMVYGATINQSGLLKCKATKVGEDTTLSQIIQMVSDAAATKAPIAKVADKISSIFVPAVILIAIVTMIGWLILGKEIGFALARGISVLVISCPCALGLATPVAIMVGNGKGAKNGILFKNAVALEETGKINVIALDKTGTITAGTPKVTDIYPMEGITDNELLQMAYSLEINSEHPLAKAVVERAESDGIISEEITDFLALTGNGLTGTLNGEKLLGGSIKYMDETIGLNEKAKELGCNKIAYAHHKEDVMETMMMSLFYEGRFYCFPPNTYLDRMDLTVIRPMIFVSEADVIGFKNKYQLPVCKNPCPMDGYTKRQYIKELIQKLQKDNPHIKDCLFRAITDGNIPGWSKAADSAGA